MTFLPLRVSIVLLTVLGTAVPAGAEQTTSTSGETPEHFIRRVYSRYRHGGPGVLTSRPEGTPYYTAELLDAVAKDLEAAHGEVGAIDSDPLCGCQDFDGLRVTRVSLDTSAADTPKAHVAFVNLKQKGAVTLTLSRTLRGWRIADVSEKDMPSLMALLKEDAAHPAQDTTSSETVPSPDASKK